MFVFLAIKAQVTLTCIYEKHKCNINVCL